MRKCERVSRHFRDLIVYIIFDFKAEDVSLHTMVALEGRGI
jgi:hypothetical protein